VPYVIEVNPLPGMNPGFSDLCLIAEKSGLSYTGLIREVLTGALRRMRHQERPKGEAQGAASN
jgi:D-alanine-D-alanine ligase